MCLSSSPSMPAVPAPPPAPPPAPQLPDASVQRAGDEAKRRATATAGPGSTILTGPNGLAAPNSNAPKSLLGGAV